VDVDFTLEDDVEMVTTFVLPEDYRLTIGYTLSGVRGQPAIFVVGKPLKGFDSTQRRDYFVYGSRVRRGSGHPGSLVNLTRDICVAHPVPSCLSAH
jgi:hypothetical protein